MTTPPSPWLVRWAHLIAPAGSVLDVAAGSGRHATWLAARSRRVTAVDRDADAMAALPPAIEAITADLEHGRWPFAGRTFDAVVVTNYLWRPLFASLRDAVAPGGVLLCETFARGHEAFGRPRRAEFLLAPGELLAACEGLHVVAYEHGVLADPDRVVQRIAAMRIDGVAPGERRPLLAGAAEGPPLESADSTARA